MPGAGGIGHSGGSAVRWPGRSVSVSVRVRGSVRGCCVGNGNGAGWCSCRGRRLGVGAGVGWASGWFGRIAAGRRPRPRRRGRCIVDWVSVVGLCSFGSGAFRPGWSVPGRLVRVGRPIGGGGRRVRRCGGVVVRSWRRETRGAAQDVGAEVGEGVDPVVAQGSGVAGGFVGVGEPGAASQIAAICWAGARTSVRPCRRRRPSG